MDFRYETKEEARDFHKKRKSFIIINGKLEFLPLNSPLSHYEYCASKGMTKEDFNKITRGYYLNGNVVFYKNNFIYDHQVIEEGLQLLNEISAHLLINEFSVYFGQIPDRNFALDFYYGKYSNGKVLKNNTLVLEKSNLKNELK